MSFEDKFEDVLRAAMVAVENGNTEEVKALIEGLTIQVRPYVSVGAAAVSGVLNLLHEVPGEIKEDWERFSDRVRDYRIERHGILLNQLVEAGFTREEAFELVRLSWGQSLFANQARRFELKSSSK